MSVFLPLLLQALPRMTTCCPHGACRQYLALVQDLLRIGHEDDVQASWQSIDAVRLANDVAITFQRHPILEVDEKPDEVLGLLLTTFATLACKFPALKLLFSQEPSTPSCTVEPALPINSDTAVARGTGVRIGWSGRNSLLDVVGGGGEGVEGEEEEHGEGRSLLHQAFHALFKPPATQPRGPDHPKCKSQESRQLCFKLLIELCKDCPANTELIASMLTPNHYLTHSGGEFLGDWSFEVPLAIKPRAGHHVGLVNKGATCYLNSSLQQLFMIPPLRRQLFAVNAVKKTVDEDKSVALQLQALMAELQESRSGCLSPSAFCRVWTDENGNPVNLRDQEDANSFLCRLINNVNDEVKGTPSANALKSVLGGSFSHQLIGRNGCVHQRARSEEFFTLQVEVRNKKDLHESLRSFVTGEMMEGPNAVECEKCGKKVDTLKRTTIAKLPRTLCVTLMRFSLDFQTMQTTKMNDRIEFPVDLDMTAYTEEALNAQLNAESNAPKAPSQHPNEYYHYKLRGMIVHTGTANSGHYYSFIQERQQHGGEEGQWFKFNDRNVAPWDPEQLADVCFGDNPKAPIAYGGRPSAYMLFYDRIQPRVEIPPAIQNTPVLPLVRKFADKLLRRTAAARKKARMPGGLFDSIWKRNVIRWRDKTVFAHNYINFAWNIAVQQRERCAEGLSVGPGALRFLTRFFLAVLCRSIEKDSVTPWIDILKMIYSENMPACVWLMGLFAGKESAWVEQFLLSCPSRVVRDGVADLLMLVVRTVGPAQTEALTFPLPPLRQSTFRARKSRKQGRHVDRGSNEGSPRNHQGNYPTSPSSEASENTQSDAAEDEMTTVSEEEDCRAVMPRFVDRLLGYLHLTTVPTVPNQAAYLPYFRVLNAFASIGPAQIRYLEDRKTLEGLLDLYLGQDAPEPTILDIPLDRDGCRTQFVKEREFEDFIALLSTLVVARSPNKETPLPHTLLCDPCLDQIFFEARNCRTGPMVCRMFEHVCRDNKTVTDRVLGHIAKLLGNHCHHRFRPLMRVLFMLLRLEDTLQSERTETIVQMMFNNFALFTNYWKETDHCCEHLLRWAERLPAVKKLLVNNWTPELSTLLTWLRAHPQAPPNNKAECKLQRRNPVKNTGLKYIERHTTFTQSRKRGVHGRSWKDKIAQVAALCVTADGGKQAVPNNTGESPSKLGQESVKPAAPVWNTAGNAKAVTEVKAKAVTEVKADHQQKAMPEEEGQSNTELLDLDYDSDVDKRGRKFTLKQQLEVQDTLGEWLVCEIIDIDVEAATIHVHYVGFKAKYDEWIHMDSPRLELTLNHFAPPLRTRVVGTNSYYHGR